MRLILAYVTAMEVSARRLRSSHEPPGKTSVTTVMKRRQGGHKYSGFCDFCGVILSAGAKLRLNLTRLLFEKVGNARKGHKGKATPARHA